MSESENPRENLICVGLDFGTTQTFAYCSIPNGPSIMRDVSNCSDVEAEIDKMIEELKQLNELN